MMKNTGRSGAVVTLVILTLCGAANAFQSEWRRSKSQSARYSPCTGVYTPVLHT